VGRCKVQVKGSSGVLDYKMTAGVLRVNLSGYLSLDYERARSDQPC